MESFKKRFSNIQANLKAPKNLFNKFGKFNYRNAESILEAVKPFLVGEKMILTLEDEILPFGDRLFVKSTALVSDLDSNEHISASALAEIDNHAGMSADQSTGCASSYARKYALNGLFLLDDTKDEDSDEFKEAQNAKAAQTLKPKAVENKPINLDEKINQVQVGALMKRIGDDTSILDYILNVYKITSLNDLTIKRYEELNRKWEGLVGAAHESKNKQSPAQS